MIHESSPWKTALIRDAALLERWAAKPCSARRTFLIERKVFLAAYSLRKLGEDVKISNATLTRSVGVRVSPPLRSGFSNLRHWVERYFDLENSERQQLTWRQVLNMIIHSAFFAELIDEDERVTGFMLTSEKEIKRGLVHVQLSDLVELMRTASVDYPTLVHQTWDAKAGKWTVWAGHGTLNLDKATGG